ncbi:MAG: non-ribosomal peptide synthetase, partial [bacterium]|nr:non-ribosomal peptide synthetase [bacterium]
MRETFFRSFRLSKAPLLRVTVIETTHTGIERYMLLDMHHIISDGASMDILTKEFFALSAGENLPPLKLQYRDYAEWQNSTKQKESNHRQEEFWIKTFSGELPALYLPTDYTRPKMRSFEGNKIAFTLNKSETGYLKETAKENEATLYMTILSLFTILMSKLSGQQDIIVGTPTAGRRHADLENIIGMFVSTLAMRNYPHSAKTYREFLKEVKKRTLQAFENQEYQFEDLVDRLSVKRDTGRNPIFDVMFNLLNQAEYQKQDISTAPTMSTTSTTSTAGTSKFDLTLNAAEEEDHLNLYVEYCTKLFKEGTIRRYIAYFKGILQTVHSTPNQKIENIEIITEEEKQQILYKFNDTAVDY